MRIKFVAATVPLFVLALLAVTPALTSTPAGSRLVALARPPAAPAAQSSPIRCTVSVPANPLSADGLASVYWLGGGGDGQGCHESNAATAVFVQAAAIDPNSGQISVYDPLVSDRDTAPAIPPTRPDLPAGSVVAIWFGFNGAELRLDGPGRASCIDGVRGSIFGQNAFCNTDAFWAAANAAVQAGKLQPPALGPARDGKTCPTTHDFSVVDQDQSDNTTTQYLVTADGLTAQDIPQNAAKLNGARVQTNGSDERLLAVALDRALGCTPWTAPDLADPTHTQRVPALPLNELQASARQAPPAALVPALDPFVLVNGQPNLVKLNAYRAGDGQPQVGSLAEADTTAYCGNLLKVGLPRVLADRDLTSAAASPFPDQADNLFDFLGARFSTTFGPDGGLDCQHLLHVANPVKLQTDGAGVVTGATIDLAPPPES